MLGNDFRNNHFAHCLGSCTHIPAGLDGDNALQEVSLYLPLQAECVLMIHGHLVGEAAGICAVHLDVKRIQEPFGLFHVGA